MNYSLDNVVSVYSGRVNACMCGCAGKHTYASTYQDLASKDRGYTVTDDEVSDRSVKTIFNKVFSGKYGKYKTLDKYPHIVYVDTDTRTYTVYFKK